MKMMTPFDFVFSEENVENQDYRLGHLSVNMTSYTQIKKVDCLIRHGFDFTMPCKLADGTIGPNAQQHLIEKFCKTWEIVPYRGIRFKAFHNKVFAYLVYMISSGYKISLTESDRKLIATTRKSIDEFCRQSNDQTTIEQKEEFDHLVKELLKAGSLYSIKRALLLHKHARACMLLDKLTRASRKKVNVSKSIGVLTEGQFRVVTKYI